MNINLVMRMEVILDATLGRCHLWTTREQRVLHTHQSSLSELLDIVCIKKLNLSCINPLRYQDLHYSSYHDLFTETDSLKFGRSVTKIPNPYACLVSSKETKMKAT